MKRKIREEKSKDRRDERNGARTSNHKTRNRKGQKNTHVHFSTKYGLFVSKHESIFAQRMAYSYMHYVCGERLEDVRDCKGVKDAHGEMAKHIGSGTGRSVNRSIGCLILFGDLVYPRGNVCPTDGGSGGE